MWVIVRPKPKMAGSVSFFKAHGIEVAGFAPIDIVDATGALAELETTLSNTQKPITLIVTSTEAAVRLQQTKLGETSLCMCIGSATEKLMKETGLTCKTPEIQTSEGLLSMPELQHVTGQHFALVKGQGGRALIKQTLQKRGAIVHEFDIYQRQLLNPGICSQPIDWHQAQGIFVTSQALLDATIDEIGLHTLKNKMWVGVSQRICEYGRSMGIQDFYSSDGATDAHLLGWMQSKGEVGHDRT
ncbi:uroporphyrinogen-III synthase [Alteromonas sediminis]|uniref:Uroporphyrinogen-III synthase n=1 Tax=Alteromonas sediminis TaxID=2259342 RepID=A0A3N5YKE8_9ALTE|nr:uroporphyrinogen-III synthase [Alteromonas sediminis]RPJ65381.1 uroporphyrinogen-III synthase [Alteromonas sediminis]